MNQIITIPNFCNIEMYYRKVPLGGKGRQGEREKGREGDREVEVLNIPLKYRTDFAGSTSH